MSNEDNTPQTNASETILPCPVCGADEASAYMGEPGPGAIKCWAVGCGAEISGFQTDEDAAKAWNRLAAATLTPEASLSLSEDQVSAVLHLVESRLAIVWAKVGAREAFANELRVLEPVSDEEQEVCEACSGIFEEGDLVYWALDGGHLHAECCGPERKSYCGPDGEPLKDDEPIPEPFAWRAGQ